jgi:hypothetical protein
MANIPEIDIRLLPNFLKNTIDKEIERVIDEEMLKLKECVEKRKSEIVAGVLLNVWKEVKIESMGNQITFIIKDDK